MRVSRLSMFIDRRRRFPVCLSWLLSLGVDGLSAALSGAATAGPSRIPRRFLAPTAVVSSYQLTDGLPTSLRTGRGLLTERVLMAETGSPIPGKGAHSAGAVG